MSQDQRSFGRKLSRCSIESLAKIFLTEEVPVISRRWRSAEEATQASTCIGVACSERLLPRSSTDDCKD